MEPTNIVSVNDDMQRVTDEASAMNKRIHYYSRLTSPADRALVRQRQGLISWVVSGMLGLTQPRFIWAVKIKAGGELFCSLLWIKYLVAECLRKVLSQAVVYFLCNAFTIKRKHTNKMNFIRVTQAAQISHLYDLSSLSSCSKWTVELAWSVRRVFTHILQKKNAFFCSLARNSVNCLLGFLPQEEK